MPTTMGNVVHKIMGSASAVETTASRRMTPGLKAGPASPSSFEMSVTKQKVAKYMEDTAPGQFKRFFQSELFDRLAHACTLYFVARHEHETLVQALDKAKRQHQEGLRPELAHARLDELQRAAQAHLHAMAPAYSLVVLRHSMAGQTHQDQLFFESLYEALIAIVHEALGALQSRADVEIQVGSLFRTNAFNLYARQNGPPRSLDTLTLKELYAMKSGIENRSLNAKMLAQLYEPLQTVHVQSTSLQNSPLIRDCLHSALVSRNALKGARHARRSRHDQGLALAAVQQHLGAKGKGQGQQSVVLPVRVDADGMVTDDSIVELNTLRRTLLGQQRRSKVLRSVSQTQLAATTNGS